MRPTGYIALLQHLDTAAHRRRTESSETGWCPLLFEPRDKVFTELPICQGAKSCASSPHAEYLPNKLIIDYKTGGIYETEQLERYRSVLAQLPVLRDGAYSLEISYIQL